MTTKTNIHQSKKKRNTNNSNTCTQTTPVHQHTPTPTYTTLHYTYKHTHTHTHYTHYTHKHKHKHTTRNLGYILHQDQWFPTHDRLLSDTSNKTPQREPSEGRVQYPLASTRIHRTCRIVREATTGTRFFGMYSESVLPDWSTDGERTH
jgi:hypothetical protein